MDIKYCFKSLSQQNCHSLSFPSFQFLPNQLGEVQVWRLSCFGSLSFCWMRPWTTSPSSFFKNVYFSCHCDGSTHFLQHSIIHMKHQRVQLVPSLHSCRHRVCHHKTWDTCGNCSHERPRLLLLPLQQETELSNFFISWKCLFSMKFTWFLNWFWTSFFHLRLFTGLQTSTAWITIKRWKMGHSNTLRPVIV